MDVCVSAPSSQGVHVLFKHAGSLTKMGYVPAIKEVLANCRELLSHRKMLSNHHYISVIKDNLHTYF